MEASSSAYSAGDGAVPASSSSGGRASASSGGAASSAAPPPGAEVPNPEDVRDSDLWYFHTFVKYDFRTPPSKKIKGIADAIHGKVQLHKIEQAGGGFTAVVMKRMENSRVDACRRFPRSDRIESRDTEDALTEIGTYTYLNHQGACDSVVRLVGCFRDERYTWLATEHCEAELFNVVQLSDARMGEDRVRLFVSQLLEAVAHLHRCNVGHRDISLENILLKNVSVEGRNARLKLIDFGQAVLCRTRDGRRFRYFRVCGKHYYRAPEVYRPHEQFQVEVQRPEGNAGDLVQVHRADASNPYLYEVRLPDSPVGSLCHAELAGYEVESLDMFAVGVCMFILHCRNPPWKMAMLSDPGFNFVAKRGVASLLTAWHIPHVAPSGMELLGSLLRVNPALRCRLTSALQNEWLVTAARPADPGGGDAGSIGAGAVGGAVATVNGGDTAVDDVTHAMGAVAVSGVSTGGGEVAAGTSSGAAA
mmetsp:Transcript_27395/g.78935  ORF Transcript_27395/g.78935 Transcript_27395/m.78935 type:complete len:476 (-) Transcript_27395:23-1450(-)